MNEATVGWSVGSCSAILRRLARRSTRSLAGIAAVSQQGASSPSERELEVGDHGRRKGEGACISRIQDRFDLPLLTRRANHHETHDRLALRIHGADNHVT